MNRLSEKTRGLLVVYTARSHCGFSQDAEDAQEAFVNHLAAMEKELADQGAKMEQLQHNQTELGNYFLEVQEKMSLGYLEDANRHIDRVCALILKEREIGGDDGQE